MNQNRISLATWFLLKSC